jgi:hypothetical protein
MESFDSDFISRDGLVFSRALIVLSVAAGISFFSSFVILLSRGSEWHSHEQQAEHKKEAEQDSIKQPDPRPVSQSEGGDKPQPESEGRSR